MKRATFTLRLFVLIMIAFLTNTTFACTKDSSKDENAPRARCAPAPVVITPAPVVITPAPPTEKAEEKKEVPRETIK